MVLTRARKLILALLVLFALYSVITNPAQSADYVRMAFVGLAKAAGSIGTFLNALLPK
jgi:hypothetical protein